MAEAAPPVIAILSPGAMGSAIAARLTAHGATVLTSLAGRGAATARRAAAAGMAPASDAEIARATIILSILPPGEADALARRLLPHIAAAPAAKPLYIDANAIAPASKRHLAALLAGADAAMVDGCIIGTPPAAGERDPTVYLAGADAARGLVLAALGLDVRVLDGPVGAAAALKMCYAAINKGLTALGAAAFLAAERAGAADALRAEMAASMPDLLGHMTRRIPDMYPKAYRWVAEMREIAAFLDEDAGAAAMFEGAAQLYDRIAGDVAAAQAALDRALAR